MHDLLRVPPGPEDASESLKVELDSLRRQNDGLIKLLELLQEVAVAVNRADSVEVALRTAVRLLAEFNGWALGHVFLRSRETDLLVSTDIWHIAEGIDFEGFRAATMRLRFANGEGIPGRVLATGQPLWIDDVTRDPDWTLGRAGLADVFHAGIVFPILTGDRVIGVMEFYSDRILEPEPRFKRMMRNVGLQLGHVIEYKHLERRIADVTDEEQRRIGEELHDSLGQQITAVAMLTRGIQRRLVKRGAPEAEDLSKLIQNLEKAKAQVGAVIKGLIPVEIESLSLPDALRSLAARVASFHGIACRFEDRSASLLEKGPRAIQLYRITQEAVHNAIKHGRAGRVDITLTAHPVSGRATLRIVDDGAGFDPDARGNSSTGLGLQIMRHRASLLDGTLRVRPGEDGGFVVWCDFPLHNPAGDRL